MDYGLKNEYEDNKEIRRTICINNNSVATRVKNCKIYENNSEDNCKVC